MDPPNKKLTENFCLLHWLRASYTHMDKGTFLQKKKKTNKQTNKTNKQHPGETRTLCCLFTKKQKEKKERKRKRKGKRVKGDTTAKYIYINKGVLRKKIHRHLFFVNSEHKNKKNKK